MVCVTLADSASSPCDAVGSRPVLSRWVSSAVTITPMSELARLLRAVPAFLPTFNATAPASRPMITTAIITSINEKPRGLRRVTVFVCKQF